MDAKKKTLAEQVEEQKEAIARRRESHRQLDDQSEIRRHETDLGPQDMFQVERFPGDKG
jgi:hypothetical protein